MGIKFNRKVMLLTLLVGLIALSICIASLLRLDAVVNQDLYRYGLQFSEEWAIQYWTYLRMALVFIGATIGVSCAGLLYLLGTSHPGVTILSQQVQIRRPVGFERKVSLTILASGTIALVASIVGSSSTLALIGLGLVFWGIIFLYIKAEKYVKETLLSMTTFSSLSALDKLIAALELKGQAIYLPPKYLKDLESNMIYLARDRNSRLPNPECFLEAKESVIDSQGLCIEPPGAELTKLFEKTLETSLTKTSLQNLERSISKILIDELEIAENVEVKRSEHSFSFRLDHSIYSEICRKTEKLAKIHGSVGCPICSALACALTKITGGLIVIEEEETSTDGTSIGVEYHLLDEITG